MSERVNTVCLDEIIEIKSVLKNIFHHNFFFKKTLVERGKKKNKIWFGIKRKSDTVPNNMGDVWNNQDKAEVLRLKNLNAHRFSSNEKQIGLHD